jgi:prevent-host-death family protein
VNIIINVKQLRASLPKLVERVREGARFTVLYRNRPAFQIVPVDDSEAPRTSLEADSLYRAKAVGRSNDGRTAAEHDESLYGR